MKSQTDNFETDLPLGGSSASNTEGQAKMATVDANLWKILADISQNLQMLSASIKAAITSLLDNTIIWDRSAQHEFMESINQSIDRSFPLIVAMTLAMKSEGRTLEWIIEPCSLPEILSRVTDTLDIQDAREVVSLTLPDEGKPVVVDYDYLRIALKMLLEALLGGNGSSPNAISISCVEEVTHWRVNVDGPFSSQATRLITWLGSSSKGYAPFPAEINSELLLKAYTASQLMNQQEIVLSINEEEAQPTSFSLDIPTAGQ